MNQGVFTIKLVKLNFQSPSLTWILSKTLYLFLIFFLCILFLKESPCNCARWRPIPLSRNDSMPVLYEILLLQMPVVGREGDYIQSLD